MQFLPEIVSSAAWTEEQPPLGSENVGADPGEGEEVGVCAGRTGLLQGPCVTATTLAAAGALRTICK